MKWRGAIGGRRALLTGVVAMLLTVTGSTSAAPLVLGVDRLYRTDPGRLVEAGELLLTELHCVNCHAADEELAERIPVTPAPDLRGVGSRTADGFLARWLANPHGMVEASRMPDLLAALPERARQTNAEALARFLRSLDPVTAASAKAGDADKGRALFHSVGCVACHAPRPDFTQTGAGEMVAAQDVKSRSVSLKHLPEKYTSAGLTDFLQHPEKARPSGRMPGMGLSTAEAADLAAYLLPGAKPAVAAQMSDERMVSIGRKLFASVGCASCHSVAWRGALVESELVAPPLAELAGKIGGCLSADPVHRTPQYRLDDFQRRALMSALLNLNHTSRVAPVDFNHRRMVRLNCHACHQRKRVGGPDPARLKYFVSSGTDLGDEGRVPPTLTGVGRKLREDAMVEIIQGRFPARPYMTTRMPSFPAEVAHAFASGFAKADHDPKELPTPRDGEENQVGRNMWGRELVGTAGLSCITCHELGGHKSLGIPAIDLAISPKRLRPEWFRDYLLDPAKFRPGTRMPAFWPDGKPMLKGHGSKTERQIDSIWVYLNEIDQSRLPEGMEKKGDFLVNPTDRPVVFRTFMEAAGMHAIAVGFPEQVHAAFDARAPRWALAWTGRFLDAEGTWDTRAAPPATPAGTNVVNLQPLTPSYDRVAFLGYTARRDYPPQLDYSINGVEINDSVRPVAAEAQRLERTITRVGPGEPVWIEVASGKKVAAIAAGGWKVDGRLTVKITGSKDAIAAAKENSRVLNSKEGQRLQLRLEPSGNRSLTRNLMITYEW